MKKLLLIVMLSLFTIKSNAQSIEPVRLSGPIQPFNMGVDKMLHFATSYTIAFTTYHYLEPKIGKKKARAWAGTISLTAGIIKEIIDEKYRKGYEQGDIIANMGGVVLWRYDLTR
mgnify:CR=1 FL=1